MKRTLKLINSDVRKLAIQAIQDAPEGFVVTVGDATRTLDQNAAQWPWLEGFAQQMEIPINGEDMKVDNDTWKEILTAAYNDDTNMRFANWKDKTILLPERTSKMGKRRFSEWLDWLIAEATTNGVTPVFKSEYQEAA